MRSIPTLFLIFRGNIIDTVTAVDQKKLNDLIQTAILVEQAQHDEGIMVKVLDEAQKYIEQGNFQNAKQILQDGNTYEQWRDKFGAQLLIGIAYC